MSDTLNLPIDSPPPFPSIMNDQGERKKSNCEVRVNRRCQMSPLFNPFQPEA